MICVHHTMGHVVDSSHRACKFGLSVSAYSQIAYGRFGLPGGFLSGGGRPGLKYGISRKIREIWQPYIKLRYRERRLYRGRRREARQL